MMWGISLSLDCRYIFAPQEHGGLWCLSVEDGSVQWKTKSRAQFKHILVNAAGSICCAVSEHDIVVLDSMTGMAQVRKKVSWINDFKVLGKDKILVEANARQWYILNFETLEILEIIHKKELNSENEQAIWKRVFQEWEIAEDNNSTI